MKLVVGLGNPGDRYKNTRHNVGFMVIDTLQFQILNSKLPIPNQVAWKESKNAKALYCRFKIGDNAFELVKPQTFMNDSGYSVSYAKNKHKISLDDIFIIHDDLDIRLGEYKTQKGIGPKLHYGVSSVEEKLGSKEFWRVRVGVDNRERIESGKRKTENYIAGEDYVLQNFQENEKKTIEDVIGKVVDDLAQKLGLDL